MRPVQINTFEEFIFNPGGVSAIPLNDVLVKAKSSGVLKLGLIDKELKPPPLEDFAKYLVHCFP